MSKTMLANPKAALGFAGVTIAIALGASFAAGTFLPGSPAQEEVVAEAEPDAPEARRAEPVQQAVWADEDFTDDWDTSAVDMANGFDSGSSSTRSETDQPDFGDYNPSGVAQDTPRQNAPAPSAPMQSNGPTITSGAAPGVAPAQAPDARPAGSLEVVN